MSLFKRREYSLKLPSGELIHHFQAPTPESATTKAAAIALKYNLPIWSLHRDPDITWSCKIQWQGKQHLLDTKLRNIREAQQFERRVRDSLAQGRSDALGKALLRRTEILRLGTVFEHYRRAAAQLGLQHPTINNNLSSFKLMVRRALGDAELDVDSQDVHILTADLVWKFKSATQALMEEEEADDARRSQCRRSATSLLRQAKSVFSAHCREYYRIAAELDLPATILEFCTAPGFADTTKVDYNIPPDVLIATTFKSLEDELRASDRNAYLAAWLALGFGLRRSEISAVRAGWFRLINGQVKLELRATVIPGTTREKPSTKNGDTFPLIDPANGGWEKIQPLISGLAPESYVIQSPTATDRITETFLKFNLWMRRQGWGTEKTIHEFRAYAGCQVAMRDGIESASKWLRHHSISITQKYYGRYLRPVVTNRPLSIPTIEAFSPKLIDAQG